MQGDRHIDGIERGFTLGGWRVRPLSGSFRRIWPPGTVRHIEPKAMQVLLALAARPGEFVSKDVLIDEVWRGRPVSDDCLTRAVHAIRQALDDDPRDPRFIETRTNVGYRLVAPVRVGSKSASAIGVSIVAIAAILVVVLSLGTLPTRKVPDAIEPPTIAVLPFLNHSVDARDDYLAAAMTEALILDLARNSRLQVISHTSVMPFRNRDVSIGEIAEQLNADLVVEGSIQTDERTVRVIAQLIDPEVDTHLWSARYDRPFVDVLQLQQEISSAIARQVGTVAAAPESPPLPDLPRADLHGFLDARYRLATGESDAMSLALATFLEVSERHPRFAPARLGAAQARLALFKSGSLGPEALRAAIADAERYESLAGADVRSHACIGQARLLLHWDFDIAEERYRSGIALNPSNVIVRRRLAWLLVAQHRYREASVEIDRIRMLDPLYYLSPDVAALLLYSGQVEQAIAEFERLRATRALTLSELRTLATAHEAAGHDREARLEWIRLLETAGVQSVDQRGRYLEMAERAFKHHLLANNPFQSRIAAAGFQQLLGNSEAALDELESAVRRRDPSVLYLDALPEFTALRTHPRFKALLRRIGIYESIQQFENGHQLSSSFRDKASPRFNESSPS